MHICHKALSGVGNISTPGEKPAQVKGIQNEQFQAKQILPRTVGSPKVGHEDCASHKHFDPVLAGAH